MSYGDDKPDRYLHVSDCILQPDAISGAPVHQNIDIKTSLLYFFFSPYTPFCMCTTHCTQDPQGHPVVVPASPLPTLAGSMDRDPCCSQSWVRGGGLCPHHTLHSWPRELPIHPPHNVSSPLPCVPQETSLHMLQTRGCCHLKHICT